MLSVPEVYSACTFSLYIKCLVRALCLSGLILCLGCLHLPSHCQLGSQFQLLYLQSSLLLMCPGRQQKTVSVWAPATHMKTRMQFWASDFVNWWIGDISHSLTLTLAVCVCVALSSTLKQIYIKIIKL